MTNPFTKLCSCERDLLLPSKHHLDDRSDAILCTETERVCFLPESFLIQVVEVGGTTCTATQDKCSNIVMLKERTLTVAQEINRIVMTKTFT